MTSKKKSAGSKNSPMNVERLNELRVLNRSLYDRVGDACNTQEQRLLAAILDNICGQHWRKSANTGSRMVDLPIETLDKAVAEVKRLIAAYDSSADRSETIVITEVTGIIANSAKIRNRAENVTSDGEVHIPNAFKADALVKQLNAAAAHCHDMIFVTDGPTGRVVDHKMSEKYRTAVKAAYEPSYTNIGLIMAMALDIATGLPCWTEYSAETNAGVARISGPERAAKLPVPILREAVRVLILVKNADKDAVKSMLLNQWLSRGEKAKAAEAEKPAAKTKPWSEIKSKASIVDAVTEPKAPCPTPSTPTDAPDVSAVTNELAKIVSALIGDFSPSDHQLSQLKDTLALHNLRLMDAVRYWAERQNKALTRPGNYAYAARTLAEAATTAAASAQFLADIPANRRAR